MRLALGLGLPYGAAFFRFRNTQAAAAVAAMTVEPSTERKTAYDNLFVALSEGENSGTNILDKLDVLCIYAAHDQQAANLNLLNPGTYDTSIGGGEPAWTEDVGYTTDGVDDWLDTNFNPSTAGGNFSQDSACFGFWVADETNLFATCGAYDGSDGVTLTPCNENGSNQFQYRINQSAATTGAAQDNASGLAVANRSAAAATQGYRNGSEVGAGTSSSTALNDLTLKLGTSTLSTFQDATYKALVIGGSLNADEHLDLYNALNDFFFSITGGDEPSPFSLSDAAYSWWNRDVAIAKDGYTYLVGMRGDTTDQVVYRVSNSTKVADSPFVVNSSYSKDDHSAGAISFLSDGRLIAAYCGHNEGTVVRVRVSTDANPANLGNEVTTPSEGVSDPSYTQLHVHGSDIYITTRMREDGLAGYWDVFKSEDAGATWVRKKRLIHPGGSVGSGTQTFYINHGEPDSDTTRFFAIPHPTNLENVLRVFEWDKSTGDVYDSGGVIGNIDGGDVGTAIVDYVDLPAIRVPAEGHSQRLFDVSDDGSAVLIADFVASDLSQSTFMVGNLTGIDPFNANDWTFKPIVGAGNPFFDTYYGGASFARESHSGLRVYIAREDDGTWRLERYDSADNGDSWQVTELKSSEDLIIRPISPKNASADIPVVWMEGPSYPHFRTWELNTVWVVDGD